jgi:HK97 family phage major capsid protein
MSNHTPIIAASSADRMLKQAASIKALAESEDRPMHPEEAEAFGELVNRAEELSGYDARFKNLLGIGGPSGASASLGAVSAPQSPGELFTDSEGYKSLFAAGSSRGEHWTTGAVDVGSLRYKGTLGESGTGIPIGGGPLVSVPQVVPGVVEKLFQLLSVEQLLSSGVASSPTVRYMVEGTATSAAAGVAEGGTKPESTLGFTYTDEPVKKIATFVPVSEELLEDAPAIQAFVNGRLGLFVQIEIERQLLRGTASGNEVQGLLTSRNVPVYTGLTSDDKPTQLFKAMNSMRGSALVEPEWVILHPTDYQTVRLLRDGTGGTAGQYMGGGPFLGPYGGGAAMVGPSSQIAGPQDVIWGKPVVVSTCVGGAGTALVGTSANACVWSRGGMRVEASNSHSNFFQINLVALRAERRLALACYRAGGFCEVRLAVGPGG